MLRLVKLARLGVDARVAGEEVDVRDLDLVEEHRAVVDHGVTLHRDSSAESVRGCEGEPRANYTDRLGSDILDRATGEELASLEVTELNDKRERTALDELAVLAVLQDHRIKVNDPPAGRSSGPELRLKSTHGSVELGHDDGVVCGPAETADPPLGGSEAGRLEDERLGFRVVRRGGLETLHVRAVPCAHATSSRRGQLMRRGQKYGPLSLCGKTHRVQSGRSNLERSPRKGAELISTDAINSGKPVRDPPIIS